MRHNDEKGCTATFYESITIILGKKSFLQSLFDVKL